MKITWKLKTKILKKIKWEFIPLISSWKCSWKTDWVLPKLCKKLGLELYSIFSDYAHFCTISCNIMSHRKKKEECVVTLTDTWPRPLLWSPCSSQTSPWSGTPAECHQHLSLINNYHSDEKAIENHTIFFTQHFTSDNEIA